MTASFDEMARKDMINDFLEKDFKWDGTPINQMKVKEISRAFAREYIATFHYSKTFPDSTLYCYGGYLNDRLCGIVCYGMGCGKNQYTAIIPNIENGTYIELTRLWCVNDMPKNTESKLISESLKLLPKKIKIVLSFADESKGHCGIIYQATNWYYLGKNKGSTILENDKGIKKHGRLVGVYRQRHSEYKELSNKEILEKIGLKKVEGGIKHRYLYIRGTKKERKNIYIYIYKTRYSLIQKLIKNRLKLMKNL